MPWLKVHLNMQTTLNKISVVVCTYNQEQTIARALDSILRQQCAWPIEILIGEDASTDRTGEICEEYAKRYPDAVRLYRREHNMGLIRNYYGCLLEAQGKYIADLAGDDEWCDPQKLDKEWHLLEAHPEVVLVHTDYRLRREGQEQFELPPFYPYPKGVVEGKSLTTSILTQFERPVVHLCTAMYRTESFRQCYEECTDLFTNRDYPCEDMQLCALLSRKGKFAYIDTVTLNYSIGCTISNSEDDEKQYSFVERVTQLTYDLQQRLQLPMDRTLSRYYSLRVHALMMHALRAHNPALRKQALKNACQWQAHLMWRTQVVQTMTSFDTLWRITLSLRKKLLQLRRH